MLADSAASNGECARGDSKAPTSIGESDSASPLIKKKSHNKNLKFSVKKKLPY
jgi:hypothetical protein